MAGYSPPAAGQYADMRVYSRSLALSLTAVSTMFWNLLPVAGLSGQPPSSELALSRYRPTLLLQMLAALR